MKKNEIRLRVMEMASEIASEAAKNTSVIWMVEFQELLVERLYRKMTGLIEEDTDDDVEEDTDDDVEEDEDEGEEEDNG